MKFEFKIMPESQVFLVNLVKLLTGRLEQILSQTIFWKGDCHGKPTTIFTESEPGNTVCSSGDDQ